MKKHILLLVGLILNFNLCGQNQFTKFLIPTQEEESPLIKSVNSGNCESCNAALNPELRNKIIYYKQSNLRDWLYQYFKSNEEQRRTMKNQASSNANLSAVVKSIPIKFGYNSDESNSYNYWNKKYIEWTNTRLISVDDIAYLFQSDSEDQLKVWLECKRLSCGYSAANYAEKSIYLDVEKIREGRYNISLTNLSIANIKITDIQVDEVLEKISGRNFRTNRTVGNKGGKVTASYNSKSTVEVNFSIVLSYNILGTDDQESVSVTYKVQPELPDAPVGTIIAIAMTYEQFLKVNNIENLSTTEQIWLPCDGRSVSNGNYITKTPDLRGIFIRGANVMDSRERLHTETVNKRQNNPDDNKIGTLQPDAFQGHEHIGGKSLIYTATSSTGARGWKWGRGHQPPSGKTLVAENSGSIASGYGTPRVSIETRSKNITVAYLIRVR